MHSITESDGVPSDPYEVLCHMVALIIEGRTPLHISKGACDCNAPGETVGKPPKPYHEGPHCPNFMKLFSKDSPSIHKCSENNVLCLRFSKLKQHLLHLFEKSVPITVEVSLGPDCLCGELRSQSTLVSVTPCKRDVVLEQWTISITNNRGHEPSQMSVMNLYQAVRSLLHFSQLTAWYMKNNGMKPANVIYRVGVPGDSAFDADHKFVKHDFPVADINKGVSIKMSLKSAPRMESIPSVYCPQHSRSHIDEAESLLPESKDFARLNKEKKCLGLGSKLGIDEKEEFTDFMLKYQGVRKKIYKSQERKSKSRMSFASPTYNVSAARPDLCKCLEYLDAQDAYQMSKLKSLYERIGVTPYAKSQKNDLGKGEFSAGKCSGGETCSSKGPDIVDDRMQITCGISGKHHCKCEYEEEADAVGVDKPRRRRSMGKARQRNEGAPPNALQRGKFKFGDSDGKPCTATLKTVKRSIQSGSSKWTTPDLPVKKSLTDRKVNIECLPGKVIDAPSDFDTDASEEEMCREDEVEDEDGDEEGARSAVATTAEEKDEFSDDEWDNPFMAAILRTTKKGRRPEEGEASEGTRKACDNSQNNLYNRELDNEEFNNNNNNNNFNNNCDYAVEKKIDNEIYFHNETNEPETDEKSDTKAFDVDETADATKQFAVPMETCHSTPAIRCKHRKNLDLRLDKRLSAVRNLSDFDTGNGLPENYRPSEFISKSLSRLKSLFYKRDFTDVEGAVKSGPEMCRLHYEADDTGSGNSTKTIPVPSAQDKLKFRRSLDSAAQLVFHRCSGLPLTSSPAPVRRNNSSFSFDSSLNSVSAIKSALFDSANSISSEDENESEGSLRSPASPGAWSIGSKSINYHSLSPLPLLGTFEESVLNGRLEPVSTVHGFTAELGASGSFCPRHMYLPVTVFFYTLGDNDKVSAPYLGHINLGKKGYNVPRSGTIQVTLFNPLRTVVKMFVVVYDLHDMPPNSQTFLRQRTLYVPASQKEAVFFDGSESAYEHGDHHKYLRYLIHLRFISGKTGRIYLHTDIRMIIFRKADEDTATALGRQVDGETYELRSHTHGPTNPKFSPRK